MRACLSLAAVLLWISACEPSDPGRDPLHDAELRSRCRLAAPWGRDRRERVQPARVDRPGTRYFSTGAPRPVDGPAIRISQADVDAGRGLFMACALCHGRDAVSGGAAPDLRESALALDLEGLRDLLRTGSLIRRGMPRYETLTDDEIRQIHAYIRARARETLTGQR